MRPLLGGTCLVLGVGLAALPAVGEVRLVTRPDGSRYMYNVGGSAPAPVPTRGTTQVDFDLESLIVKHSQRQRLDPDLVRAVIVAESAFDVKAVSRKGAMGLMQLMPETARELAVSNAFDPEENLRGGTRYLRRMIDAFDGSLEMALAAYNAGPDAVRRFDGVPPYRETIDYVEKIMRIYHDDPQYAVRGNTRLGRGRRTFLSTTADGKLLLSTAPPRGATADLR